jgi:flagellar hook assembly protein FlgD
MSLIIYDSLGHEVITLVKGQKSSGTYKVGWDGRDSSGKQVASGNYFYQLKTHGGYVETKKMMLAR